MLPILGVSKKAARLPKMKLAFYLPCYWPDTRYPVHQMYDEMVEQAVLAEQIGMSSLWIPEHHFVNLLVHPSPLLSAVRVAAATKSIRIGTSVLVLPFYDMRRLAGEIAQADQLMKGRLEIGVGRGAFKYEFDRFGVSMAASRERFDEALPLLELLLSGRNVTSDTLSYRFDPLTITPRPYQTPMPPIWIAAVQPEAIYQSARKGYNITTTALRAPFEEAKRQADAFHKGRAEAGSAPKPRLSMLRMGFACRDRAEIDEKVAMAAANDQRHHNLRSGDGEVIEGAIVPHPSGRSLADVEEALLITGASELADKLAAYAELRVDEFILNMSFGASHRDVMASLELLAAKVMPQLSQADGVPNVVHA
jgi:alkanesulfonate monooxygenase SsuD/methylene tetrahydromethanopterin reductase-like flavin-dependent oxidoreductase (luciferase family)